MGVQSHIVENLEIGNAYWYEISCVEGYLVSLACGENHFNRSYSDFRQEEKKNAVFFHFLAAVIVKKCPLYVPTFSPHRMVCIHTSISKLHSKNYNLGTIIFIKKTVKILTTLSQFYTEIVDFHWVHIRSLICGVQ